jgi:DNA replication protein DnaC
VNLEDDRGHEGTREYITILRMLEKHSVHRVAAAVERALIVRAPSASVVGVYLYPDEQTAPATFLLDGRPHLQAARIAVLREYVPVAASCAENKVDYATYLLRLTERELLDRERRAADRRLKMAKFPVVKTLDTIDFKAQPSVNESLVRELMRGEYIGRKENVLIVGNSGTGKTHLATALAFAACAQGRKVRFYTVTELVRQLLEQREEKTLQRLLTQIERCQLLVLDELGYVPFTKAGAELLFEVISRAYERTSLILTTNLPFEDWTEVLGSERLTGALLDRLTHRVHILEANGQSYRLRQAKELRKQTPNRGKEKTRKSAVEAPPKVG